MTNAVRSGIRTTFRQTNFRSRLEARWAAFFDLVGWKWTYEPFDADGYIPDFLVHGPASILVEVGPCELLSDFSTKAQKPREALPGRATLILGIDPTILPTKLSDPAAGYLTDSSYAPDVAHWARCLKCGWLGVYHESGSWDLRPCGHGDRDRYHGDIREGELFDWWAEAGNRVQWRR